MLEILRRIHQLVEHMDSDKSFQQLFVMKKNIYIIVVIACIIIISIYLLRIKKIISSNQQFFLNSCTLVCLSFCIIWGYDRRKK